MAADDVQLQRAISRGVIPGPRLLVVIGGGVAKSGELLFDPVRAALADYAGLEFLRGLRVVPAELGGDAGLVGAAALARG